MTKQEKTMKKYTRAVERRLDLPRDVKTRVMNDFISSIAARREAGESDEQIFAELGTPKEAARVLNEQMREYNYRKSPWRWVALVSAVLAGLMLAFNGVAGLLAHLLNEAIHDPMNVGVIGGVDGPTAVFVTVAPSDPGWVVWSVVLVAGILGWHYLSRLKQE